jgi:hypothetical protein
LLGYVHYDLHSNNVLVTRALDANVLDADTKYKSVLIDFGRVIEISHFYSFFNKTIGSFLKPNTKKKEKYITDIRDIYNRGSFNIINTLNIHIKDVNAMIKKKMDEKINDKLEDKLASIAISVMYIDKYILAYKFHNEYPQSQWLSESDINTDLFINETFNNNKKIKMNAKGFPRLTQKYWEVPKDVALQVQAQKVKKRKCPNGTRRNKKTGECEPRGVTPSEPHDAMGPLPVKKPRCPKGTRRNKKTGNCVSSARRGNPVRIQSEHKETQKSPAEQSQGPGHMSPRGLKGVSPLGLKGVSPLGLPLWVDNYIQANNLSLNDNERYVKLLHMNKVQDSFTPLFKNDVDDDEIKDIFKDLYIVKTIGDGSCFIHALFAALSKNYLRMNDNDKKDMAKYFRKNVLAKMDDDEYKSESGLILNPEKTKEYKKNFANEKFYLTNEEIILLANKYKINFLFFKTGWNSETDISPIYVNNDPKNRDKYDWIYIENSGVHYETIIHDNDAGEVYMTFSPKESQNILDKLKFRFYGA